MKIRRKETSIKKRKILPWLPSRISTSRLLDFSLGFVGTCLAAASAYLPWHVYQNSGDYQPPKMVFSGELSDETEIDQIITGSTGEAAEPLFETVTQRVQSGVLARAPLVRNVGDSAPYGRMPDPKETLSKDLITYRVVFATPGRALLRTGSDVIAVYPGARLPDGSMVKSVNRQDGLWEVADTSGRVFR